MKGKLNYHILKTASGCLHPYYSTTSSPLDPALKMHARVSVYPPLDQETILAEEQDSITFHVLLETDPVSLDVTQTASNDPWLVEVWHNQRQLEHWDALTLSPVQDGTRTSRDTTASTKGHKWFIGKLARTSECSHFSFTVRFRSRNDENWRWVRDATSEPDGEIIFRSPFKKALTPPDLLKGLAPEVKWSEQPSETANSSVWLLESPVVGADDPHSGFTTSAFGVPENSSRWFSLVRLWSPWLAPRHGQGTKYAHEDGILYSFQRKDGLHLVALAISGIEDVQTLLIDDNGKLSISSRNDRQSEGTARVCLALAKTFDEANAAAIYLARKLVTQFFPLTAEHQEIVRSLTERDNSKDVKANWAEDWYDGFTYCTWNGLGQDLTEEKVRTALSSLEEHGIKITNLIIDDNWQTLDNEGENQFMRGWIDFEANKQGWPQGLKAATTSIRDKHPSIKHIGVWHAIMGYWGGISPNGEIAKRYKTRKVRRIGARPGFYHVVDDEDIGRMYKDFYAFLEASGVDSVKTDAQFAIDELDESTARRDLTTAYLSAWSIAQLKHMGAHAISCMSQVPQIIFHSQLPQHTPALILRNSDDFFPNVPDSHPWHVFCNAHNSLLTKHLNVLPDYDMFQSNHPWSGFHAASRVVSGGPVYITDEPGKHDTALIKKMTAKTARGQTVVLRPSVVGRSIHQYVGYEDERLLFIGAFNGYATTGSSFMGVFNCRSQELTEILPLEHWLGAEKGEWVVRSHQTGHIGSVQRNENPDEAVEAITVAAGGWDVLTARPVSSVHFDGTSTPVRVADFGLVGQMTGAAAILSSIVGLEPGRIKVQSTLKALGTWGVWIDKRIDLGDSMVTIQGQAVPVETVHVQADGTLEVDLEQAWEKLGLSSGYSNEVNVSAHIKITP